MTYRYIFLFLHTVNGMFEARKSRVVARLGWRRRSAWITVDGRADRRSFKMSNDVYAAMLARGFTGEIRTYSPLSHARPRLVGTGRQPWWWPRLALTAGKLVVLRRPRPRDPITRPAYCRPFCSTARRPLPVQRPPHRPGRHRPGHRLRRTDRAAGRQRLGQVDPAEAARRDLAPTHGSMRALGHEVAAVADRSGRISFPPRGRPGVSGP